MGGDQHVDAEPAQAANQLQHFLPPLRVQAGGRFVQQGQLRVVHDGLGQFHPLFHPGGVVADVADPFLRQAHQEQGFGGPVAGLGGGQPRQLGRVHYEIGGRLVQGQAVVLRHVSQPGAQSGGVLLHRGAQHLRLSAVGPAQAQQDAHQGGFPRSVGPHQPGYSGGHGDVHPVQGPHLSESFHQLPGLDDGLRHGRFSGTGGLVPPAGSPVAGGRSAIPARGWSPDTPAYRATAGR